jgi:hypothetical protein
MGNFVIPKTPPSPTVPAGGAAGQILAKINDINFNTQWINNTDLVGFTLPTLTSGSVLFSNGTTIAQDNANFFWDDTNNRLGIGTNVPAFRLDINGTSRIQGDLNIGLTGANSNLNFPNTTGNFANGFQSIFSGNSLRMFVGSAFVQLDGSASIGLNGNTTVSGINGNPALIINQTNNAWTTLTDLRGQNVTRFRFLTNGNLLIGTTTDSGGKLQIVPNGAASTDIALRIRNSGDTADILTIAGNGILQVGNFNNSTAGLSSTIVTQGRISASGGFTLYNPAAGDNQNTGLFNDSGPTIYHANSTVARFNTVGGSLNGTNVAILQGYNPGVGTGNVFGFSHNYTLFPSVDTGVTYTSFYAAPVWNAPVNFNRLTGTIRGFYFNPTLYQTQKKIDIRAIETTAGRVVFGGPTQEATSGSLSGILINQTLTAAANNDSLIGLDINQTYTNGAFTGVSNIALRTVTGDVIFGSTSGNVGIKTSTPFSGSTGAATGVDIGIFNSVGNESNLMVRGFASLGGISRSGYGAVGSNYYLDAANSLKRRQADSVSVLEFSAGAFLFKSAGNGAANSAIGLTETMRLTATGNLGIANTNPSFPLVVGTNTGGVGSDFSVQISSTAAKLTLSSQSATMSFGANPQGSYTNGVPPGASFGSTTAGSRTTVGCLLTVAGGGTYVNFSTNGASSGFHITHNFGSDLVTVLSNNNFGIGIAAPIAIFQVKTTTANTNGSIAFLNNNAVATIGAITDTGSALTMLQFRGAGYNFTDLGTNGFVIQSSGYGTSATPSAILQVDSTTKGFLPPRMTTLQKIGITLPAKGLIIFDTDLNKLCVFTTAWETVTSV